MRQDDSTTLSFRERLLGNERLIGSFVKIPAPQATEILGDLGFDFIVIDEEHGPFDRGAADIAILAARASGMASLVRATSADPFHIQPALDSGATGVLAPHVSSVEIARKVAQACRYQNGKRGFSASTRAGRYGGIGRWDLVKEADAQVTMIAQIEDPEALNHVDAIAAVEGVDALFIGRGDLTVAMGLASSEGPEMTQVIERIAAAARKAGKALCAYAGGRQEIEMLERHGATAFVVSSDQGFLRQEAARALTEFHSLTTSR